MIELLRLTLFGYLVTVGLCQETDITEYSFDVDDPDSNYLQAGYNVIRNEYICYGDPHCYLSVFANATGIGWDEICFRVNGTDGAWYNFWNHTVFGVEADFRLSKPGAGAATYITEVKIIISGVGTVHVQLVGNALVFVAPSLTSSVPPDVDIIASLKEIQIRIRHQVYICLRAQGRKIFVYIRILRKIPKGDLRGILGDVEIATKAIITSGPTLVLEDSTTYPLGRNETHRWHCRIPLYRTCYRFEPIASLIGNVTAYLVP